MKNIIIGITLSLFAFSCSKETPEPIQMSIENTVSPAVGFDDLEVGDEFNYVYFLGESYYDTDNSNYQFTRDTLNFEVCGFKDGKFVVQEKITPASAILNEEVDYWLPQADSVFTYLMYVRNDSLITEQYKDMTFQSHLFNSEPRNLTLRPYVESDYDILGWKTTFPYHEDLKEIQINNADISGNIYPSLNVLMNNIAMAADGDGLSYFYSKEDGIVRTSRYSWWTSQGVGWELLIE